jgi:hypothetical protein
MEIRMWVLTIISAAAAATDMEEKIVHKSTWLLSICLWKIVKDESSSQQQI